jgi:plastocyanin
MEDRAAAAVAGMTGELSASSTAHREDQIVQRLRTVAVISAMLLAVAACQAGASPAAQTPAAPGATEATPPPAGAGSSATIKDLAFEPADLTTAVGGQVTWTNMDGVAHTVTLDDGSVDSGNLQNGATFSHTFTSAGTFAYHCNIHPSMKGTVTVSG